MKTNFSYNFATYSKQESPQLDVEAILDTVDYIVCPHKRICRLKDDDQMKIVHLFHNAVPYFSIHRSAKGTTILYIGSKDTKCK